MASGEVSFEVVDRTFSVVGLGAALEAKGITQSQFARETDLAPAYIWRLVNGGGSRVRGAVAEKCLAACEELGIQAVISDDGAGG